MTDRIFLDTNILVYLFDTDSPAKQRTVRELLSREALAGKVMLSTQVLQEFYVTVTRKLATPVEPEAAYRAVQDFTAFSIVKLDSSLILAAIVRSQTAQFSFWDALIVEAAIEGGAKYLYSEDFQDGQIVDGAHITNPFSHVES